MLEKGPGAIFLFRHRACVQKEGVASLVVKSELAEGAGVRGQLGLRTSLHGMDGLPRGRIRWLLSQG